MVQLKITRDTFLKLDPTRQASELAEDSKCSVQAGTIYKVSSFLWRGNYLKVALDGVVLKGKNTWYCFGEHVQIQDDSGAPLLPTRVQLSVQYRSQLDNDTTYFREGWRQCHLTAVTMFLDYITNGKLTRDAQAMGFSEPETLYGKKLAPYGDTTKPEAHTACLKECFNLNTELRTDLTKADLLATLAKGRPVPLGVAWHEDGHWVCCVGYDAEGLIVHDPYGIRLDADTFDIGADGSFNHYSWAFLDQIYWDQGPESGWGRFVL